MRNISSFSYKLIVGLIMCLIWVSGCGVQKPIQPREEIIYTYKDSINYKDSTIYHHLYKEYYRDYSSMLDTLKMQTSYSTAKAYLDTTNRVIKGEMENKDIDIPVQIKWKEKIVYRDSLVKIEVPVEVEVIKEVKVHFWYERYLWIMSIAFILIILYEIFKKKLFL